jgi:hypothetical protein
MEDGSMNEMIDRVARALYEIQPDTDDDGHVIPWAAFEPGDDREACINAAQIAIKAMREPTDAMVTAGNGDCMSYFGDEPFPSFERGWASAIDAALT